MERTRLIRAASDAIAVRTDFANVDGRDPEHPEAKSVARLVGCVVPRPRSIGLLRSDLGYRDLRRRFWRDEIAKPASSSTPEGAGTTWMVALWYCTGPMIVPGMGSLADA